MRNTENLTWIENPESVGLRFVGLAHDAAPSNYAYSRPAVDHIGWYLDDNGFGETVSGVVYQLPAKNGLPRYIVGYADPWNCDKYGEGPACLDLTKVIIGKNGGCSFEADPTLRDAARLADSYAEWMAQEAREYDREWRNGQNARQIGEEMREARERFHDALDTEHRWSCDNRDAWREGYASY